MQTSMAKGDLDVAAVDLPRLLGGPIESMAQTIGRILVG